MATLSNVFNSNPFVGGGMSINPALASKPVVPASAPIFNKPVAPVVNNPPAADPYAKYRDANGNIMTPDQYAAQVVSKIPTGGDVGTYAGNSYSAPNQSANSLNTTANKLNNARNDIATGTTDPYGVASKSGVAYTADELNAIEKAYAGIYDPALNDVMSRLKDKQTADTKAATTQEDMQKIVFQTNEDIRKWQATTGTKGNSASDTLTNTQIRTAARNAGVTIDDMSNMDPDLANFFLAPPKVKDATSGATIGLDKQYANDMQAIKDGSMTVDEVTNEINNATLSPAVIFCSTKRSIGFAWLLSTASISSSWVRMPATSAIFSSVVFP